jgi:hypothetical protein
MEKTGISTMIVETIPLSFIVFSIVSGTIFLYCSFLGFWLPSWFYVLTLSSSSETLSSLLVIFVFSLIVGATLDLLSPLFVSNFGLNALISCSRNKKEEKKGEETFSDDIQENELEEWLKWVEDHKLRGNLEFQWVKEAIVRGLIVGSEIVILVNFLGVIPWILVDAYQFNGNLLLMVFIPYIIGIPSWLFDKYYFKNHFKEERRKILRTFREYLKKKPIGSK